MASRSGGPSVVCSTSLSGRGSCWEVNSSGPSGIEAPKENRRARLPYSASTSGNSRMSCRPGGCALVSMLSTPFLNGVPNIPIEDQNYELLLDLQHYP